MMTFSFRPCFPDCSQWLHCETWPMISRWSMDYSWLVLTGRTEIYTRQRVRNETVKTQLRPVRITVPYLCNYMKNILWCSFGFMLWQGELSDVSEAHTVSVFWLTYYVHMVPSSFPTALIYNASSISPNNRNAATLLLRVAERRKKTINFLSTAVHTCKLINVEENGPILAVCACVISVRCAPL
jgi:hypothetical protein